MAHALLIQVQLDPNADIEHRHGILKNVVIPEATALPGFRRGMWMNDGNGTGTCIVVFDTEANARSAVPPLTPPGGPPVISTGVHDVEAEV